MKKRSLILILMLFCLFFRITDTKALVVGQGQGTSNDTGGPGGKCGSSTSYCQYNNRDHMTLKFDLWYYDGTNFTQLGNSIYITNNNSWGPLKDLVDDNDDAYYDANLNYDASINNNKNEYDSGASLRIRNYVRTYFDWFLEKMDVSKEDDFTEESELGSTSCGIDCKGYRIFIEPVLSWSNGSNIFLYTPKQMAATKIGVSHTTNYFTKSTGIKFNTEYDDVGVAYHSSDSTFDRTDVANTRKGLGYNIVDITDLIPDPEPCYKSVISGSPAFCINDGKVNLGNFDETMEEETCNENSVTTNTEYGRLALSTSTYQVYCTESAEQFFPGNVTEQIQVGTHLVWPKKDAKNDFMKIRGVKSCTIVGTTDDSTKNTIKNTLLSTYMNEFKHDVIIKWDDGSYTKTSVTPYGSVIKSSDVSGNYISLEIDINYSLPENFNRYIDKTTGKVVSAKPSHSNYIDIGYGNLSVSPNASEFGIYELNIENTHLGSGGIFDELLDKNYTCYYEVKETPNCVCPEDSDNPYKDLSDYVGDGMTCAEAQSTKCDEDDPDGCACPIGTPGYNNPEYKDLKDEMERYHLTCNEAQKAFCGMNICGCPRGTPGYYNDEYRNLRDEMAKDGIDCEQAVTKYCYEQDVCVTCPNWTIQAGKSVYCQYGDCEITKETLCNSEFLSESNYCEKKDVCVTCASNTLNAGMYLKCEDGDCNGICNRTKLNADDFCDPEPTDPDKYCPKPYENVKITACLNNGGSYDKCISACSLKCPDDSDGKDPMSKTYRNCVFEKLGLGFELNDAKKMCYEKCEGKEGINVIYRTISLSNPFPSYNSDSTVTQSGLSVGMFNDTIKGRYPGANWNSSKLVKEKILNNRGVDGDEVYSLKPLYTFVLDNATIKRIRSYNNSNKYSDFKLNCKKQGIACVSSFVHNANYGLKNGTCAINLNSSNFYTCDD